MWEKKEKKWKENSKRQVNKLDTSAKPSVTNTTDSDTELALHMVEADGTMRENVIQQNNPASSAIWLRQQVEGQTTEMELDTGATVSLTSEKLCNAKFSHIRLSHTHTMLKTYTGEVIYPTGVMKV